MASQRGSASGSGRVLDNDTIGAMARGRVARKSSNSSKVSSANSVTLGLPHALQLNDRL